MRGRFYALKGASVAYLDQDGVVVRQIDLPVGVHTAATFQKARRPGEWVDFAGVIGLDGPACTVPLRVNGHRDSAANPSFRVSPAQRQAKQLQRMMARTEALARHAQKGLAALRRAKSDVPLIEKAAETPVDGAGEVSAS